MKSNLIYVLFISLTLSVWSCKNDQKTSSLMSKEVTPVMDTHSYAHPDQAVVRHLSLDLTADFTAKKIFGTATYDVTVQPGADSIIPVSYTHLRAHETVLDLVCRLLLEKKNILTL